MIIITFIAVIIIMITSRIIIAVVTVCYKPVVLNKNFQPLEQYSGTFIISASNALLYYTCSHYTACCLMFC